MCARHDFNNALEVTQNWISDLMWRLRWHDRERVYQALIATLHALRDCLNSTTPFTWAHGCQLCFAASTTRVGIPAGAPTPETGIHFSNGSTSASSETRRSIRKWLPA